MIRTFHPIGQGAFYTEEFGAFSVVYDCGTDSKKSFLKAEIENVFEKGQIIDAVFISHLHEDHVNGLKYLMEFCRVQRLFLPLLTEQEKIHLIISNYVNGDPDPFTEELINYSANHNNEKKPERLRNAKVVFVKPLRDNNNDMDVNNDDNSDTFLLDSSSNQTSSILSGTRLYSSRVPHWVYVPFNLESQERAIKLDVLLKNNNITPSDVETFKSLWADKVLLLTHNVQQ
jgi:ribonuclease BN (tRNA processing enzyme)